MMQADFCEELLKALKEKGIHTAVDTCGFVSRTVLERVMPYTDIFLYDLKAFDEACHIRCTGQSNALILENLRYLDSCGKKCEIRIPFVPGYNDDQMEKLAAFVKTLSNVTMEITGSVTQLCEDASKTAKDLGYTPMVLTNMLDCEAKEAGKFLASIAKTIQKDGLPLKAPCAIICGGETIVRITGKGKGGRNQELALSAAESISGMDGVVVAAVGSDGTDGPTDAAGGIVDGNTKIRLKEKGISIPAVLAENNSNYALAEADALIMTGPTGTNVNDLYLLLCK